MIIDEKRKINICKLGQGALQCKYILCAPNQFECVKLIPRMKNFLDNQKNRLFQGDNCEGIDNKPSNIIKKIK